MSYSELNQLARTEELFNAGKLDEALALLDNFIQLEVLWNHNYNWISIYTFH